MGFIYHCFFGILAFGIVGSYPVQNSIDSLEYLTRFGYMNPLVKESIALTTRANQQKIKDGLKNFQYFAGIPTTGILDGSTMKVMNYPRCGNSELEGQRKKRFVLDSRWEKVFLTYKIINYPSVGLDESSIDEGIKRAFEYWSNETNIQIHKTKNSIEKPDIEISFVRGPHNDGVEFDEISGIGKVIAHAWKPFNKESLRGDMHFNDAVEWTAAEENEQKFNFLRTAIHEAGHALGLEHSPNPEAIMYFVVSGGGSNEVKLSEDDKTGIRELYGQKLNSDIGINGKFSKVVHAEGSRRPIVVPSGTPQENIPWECYRFQEQNPKDTKGIKKCYQDFYRDFYLSQG